TIFFGAGVLFGPGLLAFAVVFLSFGLATGFFAAADLGSSFFSVNSNAGLGRVRSCGTMLVGFRRVGFIRVTNAAGFTPAAAAAFAAEAASAGRFGLPSMSGLTIT